MSEETQDRAQQFAALTYWHWPVLQRSGGSGGAAVVAEDKEEPRG